MAKRDSVRENHEWLADIKHEYAKQYTNRHMLMACAFTASVVVNIALLLDKFAG